MPRADKEAEKVAEEQPSGGRMEAAPENAPQPSRRTKRSRTQVGAFLQDKDPASEAVRCSHPGRSPDTPPFFSMYIATRQGLGYKFSR